MIKVAFQIGYERMNYSLLFQENCIITEVKIKWEFYTIIFLKYTSVKLNANISRKTFNILEKILVSIHGILYWMKYLYIWKKARKREVRVSSFGNINI